MSLVALRESNAYISWGKQSSQGTAVAPTIFPRWLDGSGVTPTMKVEDIYEGDTSRRQSDTNKNLIYYQIKCIWYPRPNEMGFFETASMGAGSDTVTPPAANTTLANSPTAGSSTFQLASNTGLTASGTAILNLSPGTANEEIVSVTTPGTGAGPYTYTLTSGTLKNAHTTGDTALTAVTHTITDQSVSGSYYTCEFNLGGTNGPTIRIRDCMVDSIKRYCAAGKLLAYEVDFVGISGTVQGSPSSVTLENRSEMHMIYGVWTIDGSTTGDAPYVETFDITQKNNVDTSIQSEQLILDALLWGQLKVDTSYDVIMQNAQAFYKTYYGSTSGTTEALPMPSGSLMVVFTNPDGFHAVTYNIATVKYTDAKLFQPKVAGKHGKLSIMATGTSNRGQATNVIQVVVKNETVAAY